jgi:hypothetical protein
VIGEIAAHLSDARNDNITAKSLKMAEVQGKAQSSVFFVRAALFLRTKKITSPTAAATIIQSHHGIWIVVASHMFVSVALLVKVTPYEVPDASTATPVSLSQ